MILQLTYKCRACGGLRKREWPVQDGTFVHAMLWYIMHGKQEPDYGPYDTHRCDDGSFGVADLIGAKEKDERD